MNTFKRLVCTIRASVGQVVEDFQDHSAVVEAAIRELEQLCAQTRVQYQRVNRQATALHDTLAQLHKEAEQWTERAAASHAQDEARALECLRRRRLVRQRIEHAALQERETLKLKDKIGQDLDALLVKLDELKRRKELLASRQNHFDACTLVQGFGWDNATSVDAVLDRWESRIESGRPLDDDWRGEGPDEFTSGFERAELDASLRAELAELGTAVRGASDTDKKEDQA